ncbi:MAG TPA: hypothetical protein VFZ53_32430 [Polyangiaceae bacterium]
MVLSARLSLLFVLASSTACSELLSIDEARVDPRLENRNVAGSGTGGAGAGTTGGSSGAGGATGGSGGTSGETGDLCPQYCEEIGRSCTDELLQYADEAQCLKVCALFEQGSLEDEEKNTVGCRLRYAFNARYEAGPSCRRAGPGGDGYCGTNCEGFCTIMLATCTPESSAPYYYDDFEACVAECDSLPEIPYIQGDASVLSGDTVQCRTYHVTTAVMFDTEEHCGHSLGLYPCASEP